MEVRCPPTVATRIVTRLETIVQPAVHTGGTVTMCGLARHAMAHLLDSLRVATTVVSLGKTTRVVWCLDDGTVREAVTTARDVNDDQPVQQKPGFVHYRLVDVASMEATLTLDQIAQPPSMQLPVVEIAVFRRQVDPSSVRVARAVGLYFSTTETFRSKASGVEIELSVSTPMCATLDKAEEALDCPAVHERRLLIRTGRVNSRALACIQSGVVTALHNLAQLFHPSMHARVC
jgi:hypothetical protein